MSRFSFISNKITNLRLRYARTSQKRFIAFLRKQGVKIGDNVHFYGQLKYSSVDVSRPSLISIGNNVSFNAGIQLITHDFASWVFRYRYGELVNSSGHIKIGNNVGFGRNVIVLKNVTIGDNCFIGINSVVMHDIPSNSIAIGCPAKVICTIDEYYEKRKKECIEEAFEYAKSIQERYHRRPKPEELWEEFPLFVDKENMPLYPNLPYKRQLRSSLNYWIEHHQKQYDGFEEFLKAAGIE